MKGFRTQSIVESKVRVELRMASRESSVVRLNDFLGDPKVRRLNRDEFDKPRELERQPIAA